MKWFEVRYKTPHSLHENPDGYLLYAETALKTMRQGIEAEILERITSLERSTRGARSVGMSVGNGTELNLLRDWLVRLFPEKYAPRLTSFATPQQRLGQQSITNLRTPRVKPVYLALAVVIILLLLGIAMSIWLLHR